MNELQRAPTPCFTKRLVVVLVRLGFLNPRLGFLNPLVHVKGKSVDIQWGDHATLEQLYGIHFSAYRWLLLSKPAPPTPTPAGLLART